ncbi:uncharacterized protein BROUX77_004491 [Berkeleyomyces rouxiae]|uniref:uncharacterized protein n=1 Tax=Berkeleyomyces rouxiae TaxID=2035830 RepID=UPI003B814B6C
MQARKRKQPPSSEACSDTNTATGSIINPVSLSDKFQAIENGKRRVRKGTKSCWQCRRRKIKCEYKTDNSAICIRCTEKGETCRSQEYPEELCAEERSEPTVSTSRTVHQRLSEMERALKLVVSAVSPGNALLKDSSMSLSGAAAVADEVAMTCSVDGTSILEDNETSTVDGQAKGETDSNFWDAVNAPPSGNHTMSKRSKKSAQQKTQTSPTSLKRTVPLTLSVKYPAAVTTSTLQIPPFCQNETQEDNPVLAWQCTLPSPNFPDPAQAALYCLPPSMPRSQKLDALRMKLLPLFLPQEDINRIFDNSSGVYFLMSSVFPIKAIIGARIPAVQDIKTVPPPTSHPLCMAKKLLQLAVIVQHLDSAIDPADLTVKKSLSTITEEWNSAISSLITNDDELLVNLEGLECLLLQCLYLANMGSLRKAWIVCRRAITFAQLMGLGQGVRFMVPSVDTETDPSWKPSPGYLWYRLNFFDRYTSLLLGLATATQDTSFASPGVLAELSPTERLERTLTIASARISERNTLRPHNAREVTMSIYKQIAAVAQANGAEWWKLPNLCGVSFTAQSLLPNLQIMVQMHFFGLMIILHLPYMMKGATVEHRAYSRCRCLCASREVLTRYCSMRCNAMSGMMCRHIDYTSLVGSMTLLLSYLDQNCLLDSLPDKDVCEFRSKTVIDPAEQKKLDWELVVNTHKILKDIAEKNNDKLTSEAAAIIEQLMPIIDPQTASTAGLCHISVPYLGTVTLRTRKTPDDADTCEQNEGTPSVDATSTQARSVAQNQPATSANPTMIVPASGPEPAHPTTGASMTPVPAPAPAPEAAAAAASLVVSSDSQPQTANMAIPTLRTTISSGVQGMSDMGDLFSLDPDLTTYLDFSTFPDSDFVQIPQQQGPGKPLHDLTAIPQHGSPQNHVNDGVSIAHRQYVAQQGQVHHSHCTQQQPHHYYNPHTVGQHPDAPGVGGQMDGPAMSMPPYSQNQGQNLPGLTADAGRWAFQGVDTNYWTLFGQPFNEDMANMPPNQG